MRGSFIPQWKVSENQAGTRRRRRQWQQEERSPERSATSEVRSQPLPRREGSRDVGTAQLNLGELALEGLLRDADRGRFGFVECQGMTRNAAVWCDRRFLAQRDGCLVL